MSDGGAVATHEDITERRRFEARLAHLARHDPLTDLGNRMLFKEHLQECLALTRRAGDTHGIAVLCLDLDRFKEVNDTFGHALGDEVLKGVAERLRSCVGETDLVARLGGDEFAIVQLADDPTSAAAALAARIVIRAACI